MRISIAIIAVVFATGFCNAQETNNTKGSCSPIITGNSKSIIVYNCNNWPRGKEKPPRKDVLRQIVEANQVPWIAIDSITYLNGYNKGDNGYIVAAKLGSGPINFLAKGSFD